jgi:hypothetical protein
LGSYFVRQYLLAHGRAFGWAFFKSYSSLRAKPIHQNAAGGHYLGFDRPAVSAFSRASGSIAQQNNRNILFLLKQFAL